jgi:hypothetical protein
MRTIGRRASRALAAQALAVLAIVALSGAAAAISGGGYSPKEMDCSPAGEAYDHPGTEPGCHTLKVNVESGGTRYAEFGIDQMPNGENATPGLFGEGAPGSDNFPHAFCASVNTVGTGGAEGNECGTNAADPRGTGLHLRGDLNKRRVSTETQTALFQKMGTIDRISKQGLDFYMGADDNLDGGEHDGADGRKDTGTDRVQNGPSDGGAVRVFVHPQDARLKPTAMNPAPAAGVSFGSCADGICEDVTTYRQSLYQGEASGERNVADYDGKRWDPFECSGADLKAEKACDSGEPNGPKTLNDWKATEGTTYADPGVQIYEDPDAQGSPIDPVAELKSGLGQDDGSTPLYPLPGVYAGTCGVIVRGQWQAANPAAPCY